MSKKKRKTRKKSFRISKSFITFFIVLVCFVAIVATDFFHRSKYSVLTKYDPSRAKGDPNAPLAIIEFLDFTCQECANGYSIFKRFWQMYPDDIFLQVKYFPHAQNSTNPIMSAIYAECSARLGKFWQFHDLLFDRQQQWINFADAQPLLKIFANNVGLDKDELAACVEGGEARAVVVAEKSYGEAFFIKSTPTFFINGEMVVGAEAFREKLENYFKKNY